MADYGAIAAITRTLAQLVQDGINRCEGDIARASVTIARPERPDPNPQPRVNLFLFHAAPNAYARNDDLPLRPSNGLLRRPMVALDLFYLASFYGNDELNRIESQVLMGITVSTLNAYPILTQEAIIRAAAAFEIPLDPRFSLQQVQLTLQSMSVDELSRLWTTFPGVPYIPSVCYRASAVLIEADETPAPSLPVSGGVSPSVSGLAPVITAVRGEDDQPPVHGSVVTVQGRNLAGADVVVLFGGAVLRPTTVKPTILTVVASGQGVAAGAQALHVARDGLLSQGAPIALAPVVTSVSATMQPSARRGLDGGVTVAVQPAVQPDQSVVLDLFPARTSLLDLRRSYRFEWSGRGQSTHSRTSVRVSVAGVSVGDYLVRVTVDGAASLLSRGASGRYNGPLVTIAADP